MNVARNVYVYKSVHVLLFTDQHIVFYAFILQVVFTTVEWLVTNV